MEMETWNPMLAAIWRASWQSAVLVLIVWTVQRLFRARLAPRWRYALWLLVVARLLLPFSFESTLSVFNLARVATAQTETSVEAPTAASGAIVYHAAVGDPEAASTHLVGPVDPSLPIVVVPSNHAFETALGQKYPNVIRQAAHPSVHRSISWPQIALWAWLAGALILSARLAWGNLRFARKLRGLPQIHAPELLSMLRECQELTGGRRNLKLIETSDVESPALFGCFRLRLLLPVGMTERFSARELHYIFLHELAHIRRGDVFVNWVMAFLQVLHWFNPLVWFGFHKMRIDRELACDALALSFARDDENRSYGETILKLLESFTRPATVPGLVGILEDKQELKERLTMIARFKRSSGWSIATVLLICGLGFVTLTDAQTKRADTPAKVSGAESAVKTNSENSSVTGERPTLTGRVQSKSGEPLAATVFISTAGPKVGTSTYCPSCYADCRKSAKAAADGDFKIESLDPQLLFRILVVAKGYKPKYVSKVDPATGPVSVELEPSSAADANSENSIRGRVVDSGGSPIVGAAVEFHGIYTKGGGGRHGSIPGIDPLAVTDENGEFLISSENPFQSMDVKVQARTFANKTFTKLVNGTKVHQLTMTEGATLSGRVMLAGKPLPDVSVGIVSVDRGMENFTGYFEIGTDSKGRFEFSNLPANTDYYVYGIMKTIKQDGAIPIVKVRSGDNGKATKVGDLVVGPSYRLAGRVVLNDGKPVPPKTRLLVSRQDAWDSMHLELDEHGNFNTVGLPAETVSLSVRVTGYRGSAKNGSLDPLNPYMLVGRMTGNITNLVYLLEKGTALQPNYSSAASDGERPNNRILRGAEAAADPSNHFAVSGRVLDSDNNPIPQFRITTGSIAHDQLQWDAQTDNGSNGTYAVRFDIKRAQPVIKVEADGYLPASKSVIPKAQQGVDVVLQKGSGPRGVVMLPNGEAAAGITVMLICKGRDYLHINEKGYFDAPRGRKVLQITDENGQFSFTPDLEMDSVAASGPDGFGGMSLEALALNPQITLAAWGKITGTLTRTSGVGKGEELDVAFAEELLPGISRVNLGQNVITDDDGRFTFDRVPPGKIRISYRLKSGEHSGWTNERIEDVVLKPGEHLTANIKTSDRAKDRSSGRPIVARPKPIRQPGLGPKGVVLLPNGKPVPDAEVALLVEGEYIGLGKGSLEAYQARQDGLVVTTDSNGEFALPKDDTAMGVLVVHSAGFAKVLLKDLKESPAKISLQPWGTIEGTLRVSGKPATNELIILQSDDQGASPHYDPHAFRSKTDDQGQFLITFVPPGENRIARMIPKGSNSWVHSNPTMITVKPGEVTKVTLGSDGLAVIGKAILKNASKGVDWQHAHGSIHTPFPKMSPLPVDADSEAKAVYLEKQKQAMKHFRLYPFVFAPDGSFRAEDVPPGDYDLSIMLMAARDGSSQGMGNILGKLDQKVTIPKTAPGKKGDPVSLGVFEVEATRVLQPGDVAPDFEIKTLDGKPLKLSDFRGKYVLLDFWATWCGPCVAEMPHMKEAYEAFGTDKQFAMIGLSMDNGEDAPKKFAAKHDIKWIQGFLGDLSKVPTDYGVTGIPAMFLIDPDGKIAATKFRGEDAKAMVSAALKK